MGPTPPRAGATRYQPASISMRAHYRIPHLRHVLPHAQTELYTWCISSALQVAEVEAADRGDGWDVLFLGDSIMESTRHAGHPETLQPPEQSPTRHVHGTTMCCTGPGETAGFGNHCRPGETAGFGNFCRGTYMGAVWSDFTPVQQAWEETFGSKPYTTHTLAIAGAPLHPEKTRWQQHIQLFWSYGLHQSLACPAPCMYQAASLAPPVPEVLGLNSAESHSVQAPSYIFIVRVPVQATR